MVVATMDTLDNEFCSDSESGDESEIEHGRAKSSRFTIASTSRRHLILDRMLSEVENAPPPISMGPPRVARKWSKSLTNPPKRKSLLEQIDEDFPMTRSSRVAPRLSDSAVDGNAEPLAPGLASAMAQLQRVAAEAAQAPRRGPSSVWTQPIAVVPPVETGETGAGDEYSSGSELASPRHPADPTPSDNIRSRGRRARKLAAQEQPVADGAPPSELPSPVPSLPSSSWPHEYADWSAAAPGGWGEWRGSPGWGEPFQMQQVDAWQQMAPADVYAQPGMAVSMGVGMGHGMGHGMSHGMPAGQFLPMQFMPMQMGQMVPMQMGPMGPAMTMQYGVPHGMMAPAYGQPMGQQIMGQMGQHMMGQPMMGQHMMGQHMMGQHMMATQVMGQQLMGQQLMVGQPMRKMVGGHQMMWAAAPPLSPPPISPQPSPSPGSPVPGASPASASPTERRGEHEAGRSGAKVPWGQLATMAADAKGSRSLQELLPKLPKSALCRARDELAPHLLSLSRHTFGNYLISRLAVLESMREALASAFRGHVVELLCHAQGSRVVQAYLGALPAAEALELVAELDGSVSECAVDTHGSWGVCVAFSATHAPFILYQLAADVVGLSVQQHGCRVVQSVLQTAGDAGMRISDAVAGVIGGGLEELALHRFANYAVQVCLRQSAEPQRGVMLEALLPRLLALSTSKHGSNVAEVLLALAPSSQLDAVVERVFGNRAGSAAALLQLMEHQFGNYVLQTLLKRMGDAKRRAAITKIRNASTPTNFGRSVLARLGEADA